MKKDIVPCRDGCPECNRDIEIYNILVNELSLHHLKHSKDPEALFSASFREFNREYWTEIPRAQRDLLDIASKHKLFWTQ